MVMMVVVVLCSGVRLALWEHTWRSAIFGETTPYTESSRCGERASTTGAGNFRLNAALYWTLIDGCAAREALNSLYRCGYRFVARLWPAEISGQTLEKVVQLGVFRNNVRSGSLGRLGIGLLWTQCNLSKAIVGESGCQWMPN
jgi:hypothetical protein